MLQLIQLQLVEEQEVFLIIIEVIMVLIQYSRLSHPLVAVEVV